MQKDVLSRGVFLALQQPRYVANPYLFYDQLRRETPFYWDFVSCGWFVSRYADVQAGLSDSRLTTNNFRFDVSQLPSALVRELKPLARIMGGGVLHREGAEHDRVRHALNRFFHVTRFERLRPKLVALADDLLAQAEKRGMVDVVSNYSELLADFMLGELLEVSPELRTEFVGWCEQLRQFAMAPRVSAETVVKAKAAVRSFKALRAYVVKRPDLFENGLSEEEVIANCVLLLHAGARNTSAALSNSIATLLEHEDQFELLRRSPKLLPTAVEELLRYESPVQIIVRGAEEKMDFRGHTIGPDHLLFFLTGAANRDPEQFPEPDRLDLTRSRNRHLAFGVGAHSCVGAALARFGMMIALRALLARGVHLRLTRSRPRWQIATMRRTVTTLPVTLVAQ
ncbi:MAG: cytochrome P450 [Chthoniobacterales bacterium]